MTNKGSIKRRLVDHYTITSSQVTQYLQDQLGFQVAAEYTRWTGVSPMFSYVRMRVVIRAQDIEAGADKATNWTEKVLRDNAAGTQFQDNVIAALKPYMYPEGVAGFNLEDQNIIQKMYQYGIYGEKLEELVRASRLRKEPEHNVYLLYLRADEIIKDMLKDATSGKFMLEDEDGNPVDGNFTIIGIHGTESNTISWDCTISRDKIATEVGVLDFERLFTAN